MIWYAQDIQGNQYTLGDYGDIVAAAEAAADYIAWPVYRLFTYGETEE